MKRLADSTWAILGVVLAIAVLAGNAIISQRAARLLGDREALVQHTLAVLEETQGVLAVESDSTAGQRGSGSTEAPAAGAVVRGASLIPGAVVRSAARPAPHAARRGALPGARG